MTVESLVSPLKAAEWLTTPEEGNGLTGSSITVSTGSMVINCTDGSVSPGTAMLIPVYDSTGKIVALSQVPEDLPPPLIWTSLGRRQVDAPVSGKIYRWH